MRISLTVTALMISFITSQHAPAQEGVEVRVGSGIGVDTRGDGVRVQVGPLRIDVGRRAPGDTRIAPEPSDSDPDELISRFLTISTLLELPVISGEGRPLGNVEDFVVDTGNGHVRYAAISYPDIVEGQKLFAIPLSVLQLEWTPSQLLWRADVDRQALNTAPGFNRNQWPEFANRRWAEQVDVYYGIVIRKGDLENDFGVDRQPLNEAPQLERTSVLNGRPIVAASGEEIGSSDELILDRTTGRLRYVTIQRHKTTDASAKDPTVVVPMTSLKLTSDESDAIRFMTHHSRQQFENAPQVILRRALKPGREDWASETDAWFKKH